MHGVPKAIMARFAKYIQDLGIYLFVMLLFVMNIFWRSSNKNSQCTTKSGVI